MTTIAWAMFVFSGVLLLALAYVFSRWLKLRIALADAHARIRELESGKSIVEQASEAAKIALAETGQLLSSKLMDDHKRENASASEQFQKLTKELTTPLAEHVQKVAGLLATLSAAQGKQSESLASVISALKSPTASGKIAEIGLENLLKNFGLERGRDFDTQFSMQGGKLRPDAVVYLPAGRVMVVDCKASSFLMDAAADDALKVSMNQHLRDLASKDYRAAFAAEYKKSRASEPVEVWSVMYIPTESLAERLKAADPEFASKLLKADMILATPATLHGLLSIARIQIENAKQAENAQHIVEAASALLDGVAGAFAHVEKLGRALKTSVDAFNGFAGSANQFVLSRAQKMVQLGVSPSRGKELPKRLETFEVSKTDAADVHSINLFQKSEPSSTSPEVSLVS